MKTLNKLRDEIHEYAINKGFWDQPRETGTLLMLCVSELAEAMEADRKDRYAQIESFDSYLKFANVSITDFDMNNENCEWIANKFESTIKDTFEDELADNIIRILDLCGAHGIDIEKNIELKMKYNQTRERMHGKKY
jgi:NTP pyrophosphatase (non-canonical NTP hydrolase)